MLLRNRTDHDVEIHLDTIPYVFPATQEGEKCKVVEVGDEKIAHHFIGRTYHCASRRAGREAGYDLVQYTGKLEDCAIVARYFQREAPKPVPVAPSIHSFKTRMEPRTPDMQPRPPEVVAEESRKSHIAMQSFTLLKRAAVARKLCRNADRIDKATLVEKLFESGFNPGAEPVAAINNDEKDAQKDEKDDQE